MIKELEYDFSNAYYRDGKDVIPIHYKHFVYKVDDMFEDKDINTLLDKYIDKAMEEAAYKTMCEYADSMF